VVWYRHFGTAYSAQYVVPKRRFLNNLRRIITQKMEEFNVCGCFVLRLLKTVSSNCSPDRWHQQQQTYTFYVFMFVVLLLFYLHNNQLVKQNVTCFAEKKLWQRVHDGHFGVFLSVVLKHVGISTEHCCGYRNHCWMWCIKCAASCGRERDAYLWKYMTAMAFRIV
jgi:hypothetical protein